MNLLSNAVKFTQDGTIVVNAWIKEPRVRHRPAVQIDNEIDLDRMGRLYVSVKDTGTGIPKEEIPKLFRDFCTLQSNAHLNPNGTGLGLSICKKICSELKGDIHVQSTPEEGSTFTFNVAIDTQIDLRRGQRSAGDSSSHETRILV